MFFIVNTEKFSSFILFLKIGIIFRLFNLGIYRINLVLLWKFTTFRSSYCDGFTVSWGSSFYRFSIGIPFFRFLRPPLALICKFTVFLGGIRCRILLRFWKVIRRTHTSFDKFNMPLLTAGILLLACTVYAVHFCCSPAKKKLLSNNNL